MFWNSQAKVENKTILELMERVSILEQHVIDLKAKQKTMNDKIFRRFREENYPNGQQEQPMSMIDLLPN